MPDHGAVAVVDPALLPGGGDDDGVRVGCPLALESFATKRRALAYRPGKPWSSTTSCQIAMALGPRARACSISSRYGSQALAVGARLAGGGQGAGAPGSRKGRQGRWTADSPVLAPGADAGAGGGWGCRRPSGTHWPSRAGPPSPLQCDAAASRAGPTPEPAAACRHPRCWPCRREDHSLLAAVKPLDRLRSAQGVLRLSQRYSSTRLDAACARALAVGEYRYHTVKTILAHALDGQSLPRLTPAATAVPAAPARHARPWTTFFPDPGAEEARSPWN